MDIEKCDSCKAELNIYKGEDFFVEDEDGSFVFCEKCWLKFNKRRNMQ